MRNHVAILLLVPLTLVLAGCRPAVSSPGAEDANHASRAQHESVGRTSPIAAANSYLAAAVLDLLGENEPLVTMAEPGMCPGHFDFRPSQARQMRACRLLVRFDFQESLDARLSDDPAEAPRVASVTVRGGLCEPATYESACRQLAEAMVQAGRLSPDDAERRLAAIGQRMDQLNAWMIHEVEAAGLSGTPVLASGHQSAFCRRLGLDVAATFSSVDTARPGQIDEAIHAGEKAGAQLIVANLPEGRQLADALADRLGARVVVFGNFPTNSGPRGFESLVRANIAALVEESRP
ncbi:MAG: zinc ABC transporter substrate-binding protein [Pirellulales bacterium]|nr:zinc ABC transporter substrate-binding protein [Pirellulales bacterium]